MTFEHSCEVCGKAAPHGYGVSIRRDMDGHWFCSEHKPSDPSIYKLPGDNITMLIPTRYKANCEFCKRELDTRADGTHQWTAGWVMQRAGGGGHGVSLPLRSPRWAHRQCVEQASKGSTGQRSLNF